jgi:hypothetical protein
LGFDDISIGRCDDLLLLVILGSTGSKKQNLPVLSNKVLEEEGCSLTDGQCRLGSRDKGE